MKRYLRRSKQLPAPSSALESLSTGDIWQLNEDDRAKMTISCSDAAYIPKVKDAGSIKTVNGIKVQIMHNGLLVKMGGYYGEWMSRIIKELKGHHEPQEEKIFFEVLKRVGEGSTMIELGSFWSYYSIWFNKTIKNATNICCEPDPGNMEIGKINANLNEAHLTFIAAAAGSESGKTIDLELDSKPGTSKKVSIRSVDDIVAEKGLKKIDILHMDVQGVELDALKGAEGIIKAGKLRFVIVSTHHYLFSKDPLTHFNCVDYIKSLGGRIINSHTVAESYSGDGLIVASFDAQDNDFTIDISLNHTDHSLFRSPEKDIAILMAAYENLRSTVTEGGK